MIATVANMRKLIGQGAVMIDVDHRQYSADPRDYWYIVNEEEPFRVGGCECRLVIPKVTYAEPAPVVDATCHDE